VDGHRTPFFATTLLFLWRGKLKTFINTLRLPIVAALAFLVIAGLAHAQPSRLPDCYIVSAGIDDYLRANKLKGDVADARNTSAAFLSQKGKIFGNVYNYTLVDAQATRNAILQRMNSFAKVGNPGDFVVIFLSGHGDSNKQSRMWYFLPYDFDPQNSAATIITDKHLLDAADVNVRAGKKVFIIIDACFCGQLNLNAKAYMDKYTDPNGGGLVVIASSNHLQMSNALGPYSAYAKAFYDGMAGNADLNSDGKITLAEMKQYTPARTIAVLREKGNQAKQDAVITWSPSISGNLVMGLGQRVVAPGVGGGFNVAGVRVLIGNETLQGFGDLSFMLYDGGRAVMIDAQSAMQGTWQRTGNTITIGFDNNRIVYTGTVMGNIITGNAKNDRTTWTWSTRLHALTPVAK